MQQTWVSLQEIVKDREAWCAAVHAVSESDMTEQLNNNVAREPWAHAEWTLLPLESSAGFCSGSQYSSLLCVLAASVEHSKGPSADPHTPFSLNLLLPVLSSVNFCCPVPSGLSSAGFLPPCSMDWNLTQDGSWGDPTSLICFPSLWDHWSVLPGVQCLEKHYFLYSVMFYSFEEIKFCHHWPEIDILRRPSYRICLVLQNFIL